MTNVEPSLVERLRADVAVLQNARLGSIFQVEAMQAEKQIASYAPDLLARIEALEKALEGPARYADAFKHVCRDEEFVLIPAGYCENARDVLALSTLSPARMRGEEKAA